jgi:S1-C subfamily serine protease
VKVVSTISPSVVQIEDKRGLGSGIILDKAGHIVTNNHVVTGAKAFTVTTHDGKRYRARLVGSFPPDDLAVIKVSGAQLKPATFADSSKLRVGDLAIAIGNPLGLRSSVTEGKVRSPQPDPDDPRSRSGARRVAARPEGSGRCQARERCESDHPGDARRLSRNLTMRAATGAHSLRIGEA